MEKHGKVGAGEAHEDMAKTRIARDKARSSGCRHILVGLRLFNVRTDHTERTRNIGGIKRSSIIIRVSTLMCEVNSLGTYIPGIIKRHKQTKQSYRSKKKEGWNPRAIGRQIWIFAFAVLPSGNQVVVALVP